MAGINEFIEKINKDVELQNKLAEVDSIEAAMELIKNAGFDVSTEDLAKLLEAGRNAQTSGELEDDDLDNVTGGTYYGIPAMLPKAYSLLSKIFGNNKLQTVDISKVAKVGAINAVMTPDIKVVAADGKLMSGAPDATIKMC